MLQWKKRLDLKSLRSRFDSQLHLYELNISLLEQFTYPLCASVSSSVNRDIMSYWENKVNNYTYKVSIVLGPWLNKWRYYLSLPLLHSWAVVPCRIRVLFCSSSGTSKGEWSAQHSPWHIISHIIGYPSGNRVSENYKRMDFSRGCCWLLTIVWGISLKFSPRCLLIWSLLKKLRNFKTPKRSCIHISISLCCSMIS